MEFYRSEDLVVWVVLVVVVVASSPVDSAVEDANEIFLRNETLILSTTMIINYAQHLKSLNFCER